MKKVVMVMLLLGKIAVVSGARPGIKTIPEQGVSEDRTQSQDPIKQQPRGGLLNALKQGYARLKGKLSGGSTGVKTSGQQGTVTTVVDSVTVIEKMPNDKLSVDQTEKLKELEKSRPTFLERFRSLVGLKKPKTVQEVKSQLDQVSLKINSLKSKIQQNSVVDDKETLELVKLVELQVSLEKELNRMNRLDPVGSLKAELKTSLEEQLKYVTKEREILTLKSVTGEGLSTDEGNELVRLREKELRLLDRLKTLENKVQTKK
jgi:hypothetical protein